MQELLAALKPGSSGGPPPGGQPPPSSYGYPPSSGSGLPPMPSSGGYGPPGGSAGGYPPYSAGPSSSAYQPSSSYQPTSSSSGGGDMQNLLALLVRSCLLLLRCTFDLTPRLSSIGAKSTRPAAMRARVLARPSLTLFAFLFTSIFLFDYLPLLPVR